MLRRRTRSREVPFSFDSFLDVVANVVGIIIRLILVVWVSARSYESVQKYAAQAAKTKTVLRQVTRWMTAVPAGEIPPRIEIHFRVRPDGLRAYYSAYPILEDLHLPMVRENAEEGTR